MHNDLFRIGSITVHGYGLMIALGVAAAVLLGAYRANQRGLQGDAVYSISFACLLVGFACAKLLYCALELRALLADPLSVLLGGGFIVYGGIMGGFGAAVLYCRAKGYPFLAYFDLLAPSLALAQGFGRIGCFLAGCCYGRETHAAWGVVFPAGCIAPSGVPLVPTQLISSAGDFLIAGALLLYATKERRPGRVGAMYLVLYGVGRFLVEFLRNDYRGSVGALSVGQFISLFVAAAGFLYLFRRKRPFAAS